MKLTQEQIECVEKYLDYKELNYIDVRIEVLDHIISEVEVLLAQGINFEDAFKQSTKKWHNDLQITSSFLIGLIHTRPKIVIDKALNLGKNWLMFSFIAIFLQTFFSEKLIIPSFLSNNSIFFLVVGTVLVITNLYFYFKMKELKTTFLFLFEKFIIPTLLLLLIVAFCLPKVSSFYVSLICCNTFLGYKLYKEHQKIVLKWN